MVSLIQAASLVGPFPPHLCLGSRPRVTAPRLGTMWRNSARISLGCGPVGSTGVRQTSPWEESSEGPRLPAVPHCSRVREGHPLASRLICEPPSLACRVGAGVGRTPGLACVLLQVRGSGWHSPSRTGGIRKGCWARQGIGSFQQSACGWLGHAAGRQAGSGQAADTPGRADGVRAQEAKRKIGGSQDWGPAAQRRHCRDRPEGSPDRGEVP